jgi:hypothetical protein
MGICADPPPTVASHSCVRSVLLKPEAKGRREKMSKAMTRATGGHSLRATTIALVALAVVLLALTLVVLLQTVPTTTDGAANPAISAEGKGGSRSVNYDPAIERHAEVVQRLGDGRLR